MDEILLSFNLKETSSQVWLVRVLMYVSRTFFVVFGLTDHTLGGFCCFPCPTIHLSQVDVFNEVTIPQQSCKNKNHQLTNLGTYNWIVKSASKKLFNCLSSLPRVFYRPKVK